MPELSGAGLIVSSGAKHFFRSNHIDMANPEFGRYDLIKYRKEYAFYLIVLMMLGFLIWRNYCFDHEYFQQVAQKPKTQSPQPSRRQ